MIKTMFCFYKRILLLFLLFLSVSVASSQCVPRPGTLTCSNLITEVKVGDYFYNPMFDCQANQGYFQFLNDTLYALPEQLTEVSAKNSGADVYWGMQMFIDFNNDNIFDVDENFRLTRDGTSDTHTGTILMTETPGSYRIRTMYLTDFSSDGCGPTTGTMFCTVDYILTITSELPTPPTPPQARSYCAADGPCINGTNNYAITNVTLVGDNGSQINNTSGCDNYGDFTNQVVTFGEADSYDISIKANVNQFYSITGIFIDWNEDTVFTEDEYTIIYNNRTNGYDGSIIIPIGTELSTGFKRMRVRTTLLDAPSPCSTQNNGEVEDYTVFYVNPNDDFPSCISSSEPVDNATNVCQNTTLKWNTVDEATSYKLFLKDATNDSVIVDNISTTDTSYTLPNPLDVNRDYKWIVKPFETVFALDCDTLFFTTSPNFDPQIQFIPNADTAQVCKDADLIIDANPSMGTNPFQHTWTGTGSTFLSSTNIQAPNFNSNQVGNFTLEYTVSDANNCTAMDSIVIRVNNQLNAGLITLPSNQLCFGDKAVLNLNGNDASVQWQDSVVNGQWQNTNVNNLGAGVFESQVLSETTYFRAIVNNTSCGDTSNSVELMVNILPPQPLFDLANKSICEGDNFILHPNNYTNNIVWNDAANTSNDTIVLSKAGMYNATYTDPNGCSSVSADFELVIFNNPTPPTIQALPSSTVCEGDTIQLIASGNGNIVWDDQFNTTGNNLSVNSGTSYSATVTDFNNCSSTASIQVQFIALPSKPTITVTGNNPACEGEIITLTSSSNSNNLWNDLNNSTTQSIEVTSDGSFMVTVGTMCTSTSEEVSIFFNDTPKKPLVTLIGDSLIVEEVVGATYQWFDATGAIDAATFNIFRPVNNGEYYCIVTSADGCSSEKSENYNYIISSVSSFEVSEFAIQPNPSSNYFELTWKKSLSFVDVKVFNSTGQLVLQKSMVGENEKITHNLMPGVYYVHINDSKVMIKKLSVM